MQVPLILLPVRNVIDLGLPHVFPYRWTWEFLHVRLW